MVLWSMSVSWFEKWNIINKFLIGILIFLALRNWPSDLYKNLDNKIKEKIHLFMYCVLKISNSSLKNQINPKKTIQAIFPWNQIEHHLRLKKKIKKLHKWQHNKAKLNVFRIHISYFMLDLKLLFYHQLSMIRILFSSTTWWNSFVKWLT